MAAAARDDPAVGQRRLFNTVAGLLDGRCALVPRLTAGTGTVTIVSGPDQVDTGSHDALHRLLAQQARIHHIAPAPAFGSTPTPAGSDLVISADPAATRATLRCGGNGTAPVLAADFFLLSPSSRIQLPDALVATPGYAADFVLQYLHIPGRVRWAQPRGQLRASRGVWVGPTFSALSLVLESDTDHPHAHTVAGPLTFELDHAVQGQIDNAVHVFEEGLTHVSSAVRPVTLLPVSLETLPRS